MDPDRDQQLALIADLARRLVQLGSIQMERLSRAFGVSPHEMRVLKEISDREGVLPIVEISRAMMSPPSTLTGVIDRLVSADLAERVRSEVDRRIVNIRITDDGTRLVAKIIESHQQEMSALLDKMGPEQASIFIKSFELLLDNFEEQLETSGESG